MPRLKIEMIGVGALLPYARNSRMHSEEQVAQIAASVREFGFTNPLLIREDMTVIAGHGRLQAARKLGMTDDVDDAIAAAAARATDGGE